MRAVHNRALEWSIRAELRRDPRTTGASVRLECIDGYVRVNGAVATRAESHEVSEVVSAVAGVKSVDNQLLYNVAGASWLRARA